MTPAPISVERLRELLAKATPGPWIIDTNETYSIRDKDGGRFVLMTHLLGRNGEGGRRSPNEVAATLRLIVAMHEALPALLHQLAEREAEVARLERDRDGWKCAYDVDVSRLIDRANAAERAGDEARTLLTKINRFGVLGLALEEEINAFLAASGGNADG